MRLSAVDDVYPEICFHLSVEADGSAPYFVKIKGRRL
jgi:hypothetical protein